MRWTELGLSVGVQGCLPPHNYTITKVWGRADIMIKLSFVFGKLGQTRHEKHS